MKLMPERLFSRLHDIEVILTLLPQTKGASGKVIEEIEINLPLLRREVEMAVTVAGLRWRREVLQVESNRIDIARRMSLGKPGHEGICAWQEQS
jgi:hypothetical protein